MHYDYSIYPGGALFSSTKFLQVAVYGSYKRGVLKRNSTEYNFYSSNSYNMIIEFEGVNVFLRLEFERN